MIVVGYILNISVTVNSVVLERANMADAVLLVDTNCPRSTLAFRVLLLLNNSHVYKGHFLRATLEGTFTFIVIFTRFY